MQIRTKWHQVLELTGYGVLPSKGWETGKLAVAGGSGYLEMTTQHEKIFKEFLDIGTRCPKYYLEEGLLDHLSEESANASLVALVKANILRLPHPLCMVEYDDMGLHHIIMLAETAGTIAENLPFVSITMYISRTGYIVLSPFGMNLGFKMDEDEPDKLSIVWNTFWLPHVPKIELPSEERENIVQFVLAESNAALSAAMVLLHTRGIVKEVVESHKLNKHRIRSGKPAVPTHHVIKIGHAYTRDGTKTEAGKGGWHMPLHIRRAHTRLQRIGKGRTATKLVYIPPIIVNYTEGEDVPIPEANVQW